MSIPLQARSAYGASAIPIRTDRSKEYDTFAKVTAALKSADDAAQTAGAIFDNRHLWTLLAVDAVHDENGLPQDLKGQIVQLAEFTEQHSRKVLKGEAELDILVDINTAIMAGLRSSGAAA